MTSPQLQAGPIRRQCQQIQVKELAPPPIKTTSAKTAGRVGILKLKIFATVNIEMFRHPKYYKELRKLRNKLDQAISARETADDARATGPGLRGQAKVLKQRSSHKQVSSNKPQATKSQAAGGKAQAPSSEGQASSHKHRDPL